MDAITYSNARANLANTMNRVCEDHEPLIITRNSEQSVVMLSLEDFNALEETAYLLRSPANARRLLGMSAVYSMWVQKMVASREEARSLRKILSYSKKEEKDPLLDYLMRFRERIGAAKRLLTMLEMGLREYENRYGELKL